MTRIHGRRAVVALGGNAITKSGQRGTVEEDYVNLEETLEGVVDLIASGYELLITHGNGPQIGNQMIRVEVARDEAPELPMDVMGADIQGGLGYMIERVLRGKLRERGMVPHVACVLTMVEVDANDPAFHNPTKFVGPFYTDDQVPELERMRGWDMREDSGRGWRRVVPSPEPIGVLERFELSTLVNGGAVVICGGGGGIPVSRNVSGEAIGVEGVIDKDLTSVIIALALDAPELFILTGVDRVWLNFGKDDARALERMTVGEARRYQREGHFPEGSMGPKIEAACRFIEGGGGRCLVTNAENLAAALEGKAGTWITA
jgi:carbamate kinase